MKYPVGDIKTKLDALKRLIHGKKSCLLEASRLSGERIDIKF